MGESWLADINGFIEENWGISAVTQLKLMWTVIVLIALPLVSTVILAVLRRRAKTPSVVYRARVVMRYLVAVLFLVGLALIWLRGGGLSSLATYIGIVSAALVLALQDLVSNLAGFVFIMWRKPFVLSDRIEIGGIIGDVVDIRPFQFTVVEVGHWVDADQSTGRIVHIPNMQAVKVPVANYTTGFEYIWNEVPVLVTFESDWRLAKEILQKVAKDHCEIFTPKAEEQIRKAAQKYMIVAGKLSPIVYLKVEDSGVLLTLRYLTHVRSRRGTQQEIWEAVLDGFAAHDNIDFAYPTTRFYSNMQEGKPGARAGQG
jgi:small-conductance mechanosensitive channel